MYSLLYITYSLEEEGKIGEEMLALKKRSGCANYLGWVVQWQLIHVSENKSSVMLCQGQEFELYLESESYSLAD